MKENVITECHAKHMAERTRIENHLTFSFMVCLKPRNMSLSPCQCHSDNSGFMLKTLIAILFALGANYERDIKSKLIFGEHNAIFHYSVISLSINIWFVIEIFIKCKWW